MNLAIVSRGPRQYLYRLLGRHRYGGILIELFWSPNPAPSLYSLLAFSERVYPDVEKSDSFQQLAKTRHSGGVFLPVTTAASNAVPGAKARLPLLDRLLERKRKHVVSVVGNDSYRVRLFL